MANQKTDREEGREQHLPREETSVAGDAAPDRAPGEHGRGDLSDRDRAGSHGQAADENVDVTVGIASKGGGAMSSQAYRSDEEDAVAGGERGMGRGLDGSDGNDPDRKNRP
jgi:hypothetical protein